MSEYPGPPPDQQPQQPAAEPQGDPAQDVEYTAPITPTTPGPVFNPTTAQPSSSWTQPQAPAYGPPPYGQPAYGQQPYPQQGYGQPYPPGPYAQQPVHPYGAFAPPVAKHPQATTAMVLGIVGLVGVVLVCGLTLFVSPFAWALGRNSLKEIEASQGRLGGESQARTGMITGIIGTVLLVIGIVLVVLFVVLSVAGTTSGDFSSGTNA